MTLLQAHKLLIASATLFCAGFALRELFAVFEADGQLFVLLVSAALACGLAVYLHDLWPRTSFGRDGGSGEGPAEP